MKSFALIICAAIVLAGCVTTVDAAGGGRFKEHTHQTLSASGISSVHVGNVSGTVTLTGWNREDISVDAVKRGSSADALASTHVELSRNGNELSIDTHYDKNGIFGNHNGASVDYTIRVPASENVSISNVSGDISIQGVSSDVKANEVSGDVRATLGRVGASRSIQMNTVSGAIALQIAKNSDASVEAKTISGGIRTFFTSDIHKGYVGESLSGSIGNGSGKMNLHTVSGAITVSAQ
jgi:DUF4097 and DUF4098 domain-containing protein YvlB